MFDDGNVFFSSNETDDEDGTPLTAYHPLVPHLPDDLIARDIWPRVLRFARSWHLLHYRAISPAWRDLVYSSRHWVAMQGAFEHGWPRPGWEDHDYFGVTD